MRTKRFAALVLAFLFALGLLPLAALPALADDVLANNANDTTRAFRDAAFLSAVYETVRKDRAQPLRASDVAGVTRLDISMSGLQDLTGLAYFTALKTLCCDKNYLSRLDVTSNTALEMLYCDNNQLSRLDVTSNTALRYLFCFNNRLTGLDVTNNAVLEYLDCSHNYMPSEIAVVGLNKSVTTTFQFTPQ